MFSRSLFVLVLVMGMFEANGHVVFDGPTAATPSPKFHPFSINYPYGQTGNAAMPQNSVDSLAPKGLDKTPYNKLYTARVTKRLLDLLKEHKNNIQKEQQRADKNVAFGQSDN